MENLGISSQITNFHFVVTHPI